MSEVPSIRPDTQSELEWVGSRLQKTHEDIHERNIRHAKLIEVGLIAEKVLEGEIPPSKKIIDLYDLRGKRLTQELKEDLQTAVDQKERAFKTMLEDNLRWVLSLANKRRFAGRGLTPGELFNEGYFGLRHAAEKFDYQMGYTFSTYATPWISKSMLNAIAAKSRLIRLPGHIEEAKASLLTAREVLIPKLQREPTYEELAAHLGKPLEFIDSVLKAEKTIMSLDEPLWEDSAPLGDLIEDETASLAFGGAEEEGRLNREEIVQLLQTVTIDIVQAMAHVREGRRRKTREALMAAHLSEEEFDLLVRHYGLLTGEPKSIKELAEEDGVSRQRLDYLRAKIQKKLQRILPPIVEKMEQMNE